jgi:hypothetical protein
MNYKEQRLWDEIREFELDDDEAVYAFSDRLANENNWSKGFSLRAIEEYKKFMFLVCTTHQARTPSDEVDKVWHLHLLYTRSYWEDFCGQILKRKIHHGPTRGGPDEKEKFQNAYSQTLKHYRETFHQDPPADLWPPDHLSSSRKKKVRLNNEWIIKTLKTIL